MTDKKKKCPSARYLDKYTVRYPNGLIAIKCSKVTDQQLVMLGALIKEAHVIDANAKPGHIFTVSVQKIKEILGVEGMRTYDLYHYHLIPLTQIHIEYNILNKDKRWGPLDPDRPMGKGAGCILAGVGLDETETYLVFTFNSLLSTRILNPYPCKYSYTPIHLLKTLKLAKKKHATRLYSNLKSYASFKNGKIPVMDMEMFKTLIGVEPDEYPNFADFRTKVIDACKKEINDNSDISCSYKLIRGGWRNTKYVGIEWEATMKEAQPQIGFDASSTPPPVIDAPKPTSKPAKPVIIRFDDDDSEPVKEPIKKNSDWLREEMLQDLRDVDAEMEESKNRTL